MKKFVLVLIAVMFMFVGGLEWPTGIQAVDVEVNLGAKQVSVMGASSEHFLMFGGTVSHEEDGFTAYASAMFDVEDVDSMDAEGEKLEVGIILALGEKGSLKMSAVKDSPFTHLDTETIAVMGSYKF